MPIKCESCKHQRIWLDKPVCDQPNAVAADLESSRLICDREGDGHFVYFEPKEPTAGAAFLSEPGAIATGLPTDEPTTFIQITRDRSSAAAAGGAQ